MSLPELSRDELYRYARHLAPDVEVWTRWWDDVGRERMAAQAEVLREARLKKEMAAKYGARLEEETPEEQGPPPDVLKGEPTPDTPPAGGSGGPGPGSGEGEQGQ